MEDKKDGERTENGCLPGQLELGLPAFEKYPRTKRHRMARTPALDDASILSDPPGKKEEGPEDEETWSLGEA